MKLFILATLMISNSAFAIQGNMSCTTQCEYSYNGGTVTTACPTTSPYPCSVDAGGDTCTVTRGLAIHGNMKKTLKNCKSVK